MQYCKWLSEYTESDIEPYASLLDHQMPMAYGFVIPSTVLSSIFLPPEVQMKFIPLFESTNISLEGERAHVAKLIGKIIKSAKLPKGFSSQISKCYEELLEKQRGYLKMHTHDLHRAYHLLKHVYAPPPVRLSFIPKSSFETVVAGEVELQHSIVEIITKFVETHIGSYAPQAIPSILVQRVLSAQVVGTCMTKNTAGNRSDQMVIHAYFGAKELEDAADVYVIQKEGAQILTKHSVEQPFKYVLKGTQYKKHTLHPSDGSNLVLSDSQIQQIAFLSKDFEKEVYFPQKISFAYENGQLYITKIQPI